MFRKFLVSIALGGAVAVAAALATSGTSAASQAGDAVNGGVLKAGIADNPDHIDTGIGFAVEGWELTEATGIPFQAAPSLAAALSGADIACATTHSTEPMLRREWIAPGTHLTSVGVTAEGREVDAQTMADALVVVESRAASLAPYPSGANDLAWAIREAAFILVHLVAPMMPHLAEESWQVLGQPGLVSEAGWPQIERDLLVEDTMTLVVQVNGKKRAEVTLARNAQNPEIEAAVLGLDAVKQALGGKAVRKVIIVPMRIVNVVG